jgi:hypothetical protein
MRVYFGQIYIKPGVRFSFSHDFQVRLSREITALVEPSAKFVGAYGADFDLTLNISAKNVIQDSEVRGPTVFEKTKDVEYSIFLPFDVIANKPDIPRTALGYLLRAACSVFEALEIDTARVAERQGAMIEEICSDPGMFTR